MRSRLRLGEAMEYESTIEKQSSAFPDVRYRIARMSLGRRIELGQRARELNGRGDFLKSSPDTADHIEAALLDRQVEKLYIEWGLQGIQGLTIDGKAADAAALIDCGPEELSREILDAIRAELSLSEAERKN